MTTLASLLRQRPLLLDGGMGTQIMARKPTADDFGGAALEGCMELLCERRPEWIQAIHQAYFDAGSDAVETNTFGANEVVLAEFGIPERAEELNFKAVQLAREVARSYDRPRFVVGSVGPGTKLITLGHITYAELFRSYLAQMRGLVKGGADAILIETSQDLGQVKLAVAAARDAMAEEKVRIPIWAQVTVETTGTLLLGSEVQAVITAIEALGVDVLGLNCGTGPDEMRAPLQALHEQSPFAISCLPNAGLPVNQGGQLVYPMTPDLFAEKVAHHVREYGLSITGGCCGTTPDHIRALAARIGNLEAPAPRRISAERSVASLYQSVPMVQDPAPTIVGERTNANGSKAFRDLLAKEDWDGLVSIARDQQKEGAHMLDVCVAYVGRDEARDMAEYVRRLTTQVTLPLMIDSTEVAAIEAALQLAPGKCMVNSINFEDGEAKARKILELCKRYGAAVVGLTIDEQGMAKTRARKLEVARRLHKLVVEDYGFHPSDLILDTLTFTLGSGEEEFRTAALDTLGAIEDIKKELPGVLTVLGVSNISFGLSPATRHVVNALMLYHGVKAGLDMAIFNSGKVIPVAKIDPKQREAVEDLLFDRRREDYDPLKAVLELFSGVKSVKSSGADLSHLDVEERLRLDIIDGEKVRILADVDEALKDRDPLHLINNVLLGGMKVVGERFGAGEMQLPFVLESAEAMKAAIQRLQPHMPKEGGYTKGRMLLATVKGDVHDIGKNLVDIILSNNGFEVKNLGIKQPIEEILKVLDEWPADAIGLSGLLVKSTVIMRENLAFMAEKGHRVPVILGGAALTRDYVETECRRVYTTGEVVYAQDAFEGLRCMQTLAEGGLLVQPGEAADGKPRITVLHRGAKSVPLTASGQSSWVRRDETIPEPPFWGVREGADALPRLYDYLDGFVVMRNRWAFAQGQLDDAAFAEILRTKAEPLLDQWKKKLLSEPILVPRARYGYFPVQAQGDTLRIFDPKDRSRLLKEMVFPRQEGSRRLAIPDFFAPADSGRFDVLALQVVTLGHGAAKYAAELYGGDRYGDYFYFHGLATELTEAYAELVHARIRRELGIHQKDAKELRQLFSQGYQGSRYSFGYPACPDLEGNAPILELLEGDAIGVELSETFQMVPEYTTSALVAWHPQARYFSV